jgi:hypothetical protein
MNRGLFAAFLLPVLLAGLPHHSIAKTNEIELHWNELAGVAAGKDVDLRLTDGTRVQGELLAVRPEALSMDVSKTSNQQTYPKGQREIPRTSVSTLEMRRLKTSRWRVVGTTAGVIGGIFAGAGVGVAICQSDCGAGAGWAGLGTGVAVAILGNRLGHEADKQTTKVKILP